MKDDYTSSAKIIYNKAADLCICVSIYLSPKPNKSWIIAPIIFNSYQRCINQNARKSRSYAEHTLFLLKRNCVGHTNNTSKPIILVEQSSMGSKFTHIWSIQVFCSSRNNGSEFQTQNTRVYVMCGVPYTRRRRARDVRRAAERAASLGQAAHVLEPQQQRG
jgi:hypothetical protein